MAKIVSVFLSLVVFLASQLPGAAGLVDSISIALKGVQLRDLRKQEFLTDSLQAEATEQRPCKGRNTPAWSLFYL